MSMDWKAAIEIIRPTEPNTWRLERLCAEDHPNRRQRDAYRLRVVEMAGGRPEYPPVATMAGNAVRAAAGFVASGLAVVDDEERARRLEVCRGCEQFDPAPVRCRLCGCRLNLKSRLASSHCPIGLW